jgi:mRNA-decapping enzyme subunit 2
VVDSSNGLKSLLGIENPPETVAKNHMTEAEQDEASRRLKEMLGGILQNNRADDNGNMGDALPQPQLQPQNSEMSSDKLLSILRSEASSSTPSADQLPQALPQVQQERSVPFYPLNVTQNENTPPVAMQGPTRPNTYQTSHHRLALVSTYGGTTLANSIGLSQAQRSHPLPQNNYHLPSPPLASRYGAPPSMSQSQNQFQSPHAPGPSLPKDQFDPVSLNIQPTMNAAQYPQRLGPTPYKNSSTLTETFLSSPMPTRPPDPSQAGTLLSILKGTAPSQVAEPPRDTIHVAQTPSKLAIQITPHAATIPVRNSTATLVETPTVTAPATIQSPTPPRGPRSQITQWQRQRAGVPHRSSTTAPILQIYEPPPRPITAQGQRSSVQPLLKGTPAVIDHYGAPKTPHIPNTSFDRRESVNGQRAQTLLAMFRVPSSSSESQPSGSPDEPVMPSAEAEKQMPYEAPAERPDIPVVSSTNAQNHAKTPMGKDREVLLAYLADVAKLGGVS